MEKIAKITANVLNVIFLLVTLMLLFCIVSVCLDAYIVEHYRLQIDAEGVENFLTFWKSHSFLLKGFAGSATIFIAGYNLTKYVEVTRIEALGALREKLNDKYKKSLHLDLIDKQDPDWEMPREIKNNAEHSDAQIKQDSDYGKYSIADIYDYLGVIELGARMLKGHLISIDEFNNQFGYRVRNILKSQTLREHIERNKESYEDFICIVDEMVKAGKIEDELQIS